MPWANCRSYRPFPIILGAIMLLDTPSIFYTVEVGWQHLWQLLKMHVSLAWATGDAYLIRLLYMRVTATHPLVCAAA
jgi:hypothetical protein